MGHYDCSCCGEALGISHDSCNNCQAGRCWKGKKNVEADSKLVDRVRHARSGASIERCHMRPHLLRYSVGHHTCDVLTMLVLCWKATHLGAFPRVNLMVAALAHDLAGEPITGDIASPIKRMLGEKLEAADQRAEEWLGFDVPLTEEEELYLRAADKVECYLWAIDEEKRGNSTFYDWVVECRNEWEKNPWPEPFMRLVNEYPKKTMHPTNRELHIIGGLK